MTLFLLQPKIILIAPNFKITKKGKKQKNHSSSYIPEIIAVGICFIFLLH